MARLGNMATAKAQMAKPSPPLLDTDDIYVDFRQRMTAASKAGTPDSDAFAEARSEVMTWAADRLQKGGFPATHLLAMVESMGTGDTISITPSTTSKRATHVFHPDMLA